MLDALEACHTPQEVLAVLDKVRPDTDALAAYMRACTLESLGLREEVSAEHCNQYHHVPECDKETDKGTQLEENALNLTELPKTKENTKKQWQPLPDDPIKKIRQIIEAPPDKTTPLIGIGKVSQEGLDKYGLTNDRKPPYLVALNTSVYGHLMDEHGDKEAETARGQIAIDANDMYLLTKIYGNPDKVSPVKPHGKARRTGLNGEPRFSIEKRMGDIIYLGVAEIKKGNRKIAPVSLWKRRVK